MKQKYIIFLSVILSATALLFSLIRVLPFEVTEDTYMGTMATFLSIAVTLVIGYQILNVIEIRRDLNAQKEDNLKLKGKLHSLINDIQLTATEQSLAQKELETNTQGKLLILDSLIEYHSGQGIVTCASAFQKMHDAVFCCLNGDVKEYERIFSYMRRFICDMNYRSFGVTGLTIFDDGRRIVNDTNHPYSQRELSEVINDYTQPIIECKKRIESHKNYGNIKFEYERIMEHLERVLNNILKEPNKELSTEEIEFIMSH